MSRDVFLRLQDIRQAIAATYRLTDGLDKAALERDEARYSACMFRILNVAEAAKFIPEPLRGKYPQIEWRNLIDMGNLLRHQYFRAEADVVWNTVHSEFPKLLKVVDQMFEDLAQSVD